MIFKLFKDAAEIAQQTRDYLIEAHQRWKKVKHARLCRHHTHTEDRWPNRFDKGHPTPYDEFIVIKKSMKDRGRNSFCIYRNAS